MGGGGVCVCVWGGGGGLYGHRRVSALEEKSLAEPWTRTRVSIAPGFSVGRSSN